MTFMYIDAGLWAGSKASGSRGNFDKHRNFALIHQNWGVICDFVPSDQRVVNDNVVHQAPSDSGVQRTLNGVQPINDLLRAIAGTDNRVKVLKAMKYHGPHGRSDPDSIYIFIPDMHIPLLRGIPPAQDSGLYQTDGPNAGRWRYGSGTRPLTGGPTPNSHQEWFERYAAADIAEGGPSDMSAFLDRVEGFSEKRVQMVQLGDMIDLWIGMDMFYESTEANEREVTLRDVETPDGVMRGVDFLDHWCARAVDGQPPGISRPVQRNSRPNAEAIRRLATSTVDPVYLHGNHDCYFLRHTPSAMGRPRQASWGQRVGILAEHGHQGDESNRDGAWLGHWVTDNVAFWYPDGRKYEMYVPGRDPRGDGLTLAARRFARRVRSREPPFAFYVMGHTHVFGMGKVRVFEDLPRRPAQIHIPEVPEISPILE
jgi:hypothetical protein